MTLHFVRVNVILAMPHGGGITIGILKMSRHRDLSFLFDFLHGAEVSARAVRFRRGGKINDRLRQGSLKIAGKHVDLGRIEAGLDKEMSTCHLPLIVRDAIEGLRPKAEAKGQLLTLQIAPHVPPLRGNELRLKQVIINLVDNAIKYTPAGGAVRVRTAAGPRGSALVEVSDNGVGIPPEHLPRIFERFYRVDKARSRERGGTGLGLAIVRHIADLHGGRATLASEPGRGSTFRIEIPRRIPR